MIRKRKIDYMMDCEALRREVKSLKDRLLSDQNNIIAGKIIGLQYAVDCFDMDNPIDEIKKALDAVRVDFEMTAPRQ